MRILEILTEMPAIAHRTADSKPYTNPRGALGTRLTNYVKPGREDRTTTVYAFPDPKKNKDGKYSSVDQLDNAIDRIRRYLGGNLTIMNQAQRDQDPDKFLGFAVSYWVNEHGQRHAIGKYLHNTRSVRTGHGNQTGNYLNPSKFDAHDLGPELGYLNTQRNTSFDASRYPVDAAEPASTTILRALKPANLLKIGQEYTPRQVLAELSAKLGADHALVNLARQVVAGQKEFSVKTTGIKVESINKDYTEILHPLALFSGAYTGADPKFPVGNSSIIYTAPAGSLSDSILKSKNGAELFVSSKYKEGTAPAMGKGFGVLLSSAPNAVKNRYKSTYKILNSIAGSTWQPRPGNLGPLHAAVLLKVITETEANYIANVLSQTPDAQFSQLPADCPKRLRDILSKSKTYRKGIKSYYVLMMLIMKSVAEKLNNDPQTSEFMKLVLSDNFVTMNTQSSLSGDTLTLSFGTKLLDPDSNAKIMITTGTAYHSDHIKNALQFTIK